MTVSYLDLDILQMVLQAVRLVVMSQKEVALMSTGNYLVLRIQLAVQTADLRANWVLDNRQASPERVQKVTERRALDNLR